MLPTTPIWADPVWHLYVVRCSDRDTFQRNLTDMGVGTLIHYPIPPHLQLAYSAQNYCSMDLARAEMLASQVLSLPVGAHLTDEQQAHVIRSTINAATIARDGSSKTTR